MSASADDLAALSPAERDFALRRMPVQTLAEANVPSVTPSRYVKSKIDKLLFEIGCGSVWLRAAGLNSTADEVLRIAADIREALK